jgi:hypothetical protein
MTDPVAQTIPQGAAQISTEVQLDLITLAGVVDNGPGVATAGRSHAVVFADTLTLDSTTLAKSPSLQRGEDPNMAADIVGYAFALDGSTFYGLQPNGATTLMQGLSGFAPSEIGSGSWPMARADGTVLASILASDTAASNRAASTMSVESLAGTRLRVGDRTPISACCTLSMRPMRTSRWSRLQAAEWPLRFRWRRWQFQLIVTRLVWGRST